jgi:hypothetical protein
MKTEEYDLRIGPRVYPCPTQHESFIRAFIWKENILKTFAQERFLT